MRMIVNKAGCSILRVQKFSHWTLRWANLFRKRFGFYKCRLIIKSEFWSVLESNILCSTCHKSWGTKKRCPCPLFLQWSIVEQFYVLIRAVLKLRKWNRSVDRFSAYMELSLVIFYSPLYKITSAFYRSGELPSYLCIHLVEI